MASTPSVLMLVENNPYPQDFRVRREAGALRDEGYAVSVIAPRARGQPWTETLDGIAVHRFPAPPPVSGLIGYAMEFAYATAALFVLSLVVALRRGVHVIHAANPPDTLWIIGAFFGWFGVKFVFDHHDLAPEVYLSRFARRRENLVARTLRLLERRSYAAADVVIATNDSYRARAIERGRKDPDRVFVVRNGPPLAYQPVEPHRALAGRAEHCIGYIGTIGPQDGVDYWMRAIRELVCTLGRRDFLAVVIGDGDALSEVRSLAAQLEIEPYVLFTGRLAEDEARRYLSATEVCVQPDPSSPLNDRSTMNKLMEYMALGKPAVAFDLPETRVSAGEAAIYVTPNDVHEFAQRIDWLLANPEEGRRMGAIGRRRVAEGLAWEYSARNLVAAYRQGLRLAEAVQRPTGEGAP